MGGEENTETTLTLTVVAIGFKMFTVCIESGVNELVNANVYFR